MAKKDINEALKKNLMRKKEVDIESAESIIKPKKKEVTHRTTLDIPKSLYSQVRTYVFDNNTSFKDYVIELIKKDMGVE